MRTYLILKEKVARFNADPEIQALLARAPPARRDGGRRVSRSRRRRATALKERAFDLGTLREQGYAYERLDQLTMEILLGVR